jgi:mono/diheme cytochrome c family protein
MRKQYFIHMLSGLFFAAIVWLASLGTVQGQFTQNRDTIKIDTSGYPADIQKDYGVFRAKCNECHGLDTSLKPSMSPGQWTFEVKRMQAMASSQFNDRQAAAIIAFLNYDEAHRKALNKAGASAPGSPPVSAGRQLYEAQSCDSCHSIAGQGGTVGPALTDVAIRLSRDQLTQVIQDMRSGKSTKMPPLPADITDEQVKSLVDYLANLKGN